VNESRPAIADWRNALRDSNLSRGAKAVGFVLSTYVDNGGTCFPARKTIAAGASIGVHAVDNGIAVLERARFIAVSRSKGRVSNTYALTLPTVPGVTLLNALTVSLTAPLELNNSPNGDTVAGSNGAVSTVQQSRSGHTKAVERKRIPKSSAADAAQRESARSLTRSQSNDEDLSAYDG
jgi:hypothetical protein